MKTALNHIVLTMAIAAMTTAAIAQHAAGENETAPAQSAITPGEVIIEPPTIYCLGFLWQYKGDSNFNASVDTQFRRKGDTDWRRAMPLYHSGVRARTVRAGQSANPDQVL